MQFTHENGCNWDTPYPLGIKDEGGSVANGDYDGLVGRYLKLFTKGDFTALRRATLVSLLCKGEILTHIGLLQYWFCPVSKGGFIHKYSTYLSKCAGKTAEQRDALVKACFDGITLNGWPVCAPGQYGKIGDSESSFSKLMWREDMPYSREDCDAFSKNIRKARTVEVVLLLFNGGIPRKKTNSWWYATASREDKLQQRAFMAPPDEPFTARSTLRAEEITPPASIEVAADPNTITVSGHEHTSTEQSDFTQRAAELLLARHLNIISKTDSNINI